VLFLDIEAFRTSYSVLASKRNRAYDM